MLLALRASLKRLGSDHIDVYYIHRDDLSTPLKETIATFGELISQGRIRYGGVSNFRGWRIAEIVALTHAGCAGTHR